MCWLKKKANREKKDKQILPTNDAFIGQFLLTQTRSYSVPSCQSAITYGREKDHWDLKAFSYIFGHPRSFTLGPTFLGHDTNRFVVVTLRKRCTRHRAAGSGNLQCYRIHPTRSRSYDTSATPFVVIVRNPHTIKGHDLEVEVK